VYGWSRGELGGGRGAADADIVTACIGLVAPLRAAWHEAAAGAAGATAAA
jgi:hypothetical protein